MNFLSGGQDHAAKDWNAGRPSSIERIQLVYKISEKCNLNCSYCYYYNLSDGRHSQLPAVSKRETAEALAQWMSEGCRELDIPCVEISFHGGEPMLMRPEEFARICDAFTQALGQLCELRFSIQTNGISLFTFKDMPFYYRSIHNFWAYIQVSEQRI